MANSGVFIEPKRLSLLVALVAVVVMLSQPAQAGTEIIVGDDNGWTLLFNYTKWAESKTFSVGDTLVFKYANGSHDVYRVNGDGFSNCSVEPNLGSYTTGEDRIPLDKPGNMWFICSKREGAHCANGMKLKIAVEGETTPPVGAPASEAVGMPYTRSPRILSSSFNYDKRGSCGATGNGDWSYY